MFVYTKSFNDWMNERTFWYHDTLHLHLKQTKQSNIKGAVHRGIKILLSPRSMLMESHLKFHSLQNISRASLQKVLECIPSEVDAQAGLWAIGVRNGKKLHDGTSKLI